MKNNINQELKAKKATATTNEDRAVSVERTVRVSRETYEKYTSQLVSIVSTVKKSSIELARLFTEMDERKILQFETDEKDGSRPVRFASLSDYSEAVLGRALSEKQLSDYKKVVHKFGVRNEDGSYSIDEKYSIYGFSALEIIGRRCKDKNDFDKVLAMYSITSNMSDSKIKLAITTKENEDRENEAKGKNSEVKQDTKKELNDTKKALRDTSEKLEIAKNAVNGALSHFKEIRKIADENKCLVITEYLDKWKLGK